MIRYKSLTPEEVLEYVSFAVIHRDAFEGFKGKISCVMKEDYSVEIYAEESSSSSSSSIQNNHHSLHNLEN